MTMTMTAPGGDATPPSFVVDVLFTKHAGSGEIISIFMLPVV
jgi:hypothetical protein